MSDVVWVCMAQPHGQTMYAAVSVLCVRVHACVRVYVRMCVCCAILLLVTLKG